MKNIIFILLLILSINGFAQFPNNVTNGTPNTGVLTRGRLSVDSLLQINTTCFADTSSANNGRIDEVGGALIRTCDDIVWLRNNAATRWDKFGGAGTFVDSVTFSPSTSVDTVLYWIGGTSYTAGYIDKKCGLVSGGLVVWDSLLVFTVSPAVQVSCCDGVRRTYSETNLTLSAADPTNDRYDAIVLDEATETVVVIQGTPSSNPAFPQPGQCQFLLTYISVPATSTTPGQVFNATIYDENAGVPAEWPGTATSVTADFAETVNPYHLTLTTEADAVTSSSRLDYVTTDSVSLTNYSTLRLFIRLKATFANNTRFQLSFWNDGVIKSSIVTIANGTYGYLRNTVGTYQEIVIPIADFQPILNQYVDGLRIQLTGSNASGFYVDWIVLQGGIDQPTSGSLNRFSVEDNVQTQNRYFNGKDFGFFYLDSIKSLVFSVNASEWGIRIKDFKTALPDNDILRFTPTEFALDALTTSRPFNLKNLPQSDTAFYVVGITAGNRLVRQTKSVLTVSGADPTASVGLSAVNGVATTFMRSDAAPPLSQAIVPTWTGVHTFNNNVLMLDGRHELDKGVDVAAANDLTLGGDGNLFTITGATQINAITTTNWQAGSQIQLIFTGAPLVKNNTAGGAGTATILLAGRTDFQAAAGDYLQLQYDGTNWYETTRALTAAPPIFTADNGLTKNTSTNVRWGGSLLTNTTITAGTNLITFSGSTTASNGVLEVINSSSTGRGFRVTTSGGNAIRGEVTGSGVGGSFVRVGSATNSVIGVMDVNGQTSGTAAVGFGTALDFYTETNGGGSPNTTRIASVLTDATNNAHYANFVVSSAANGTLYEAMTISPIQTNIISRDLTTSQQIIRYSTLGAYKTLTDATATSFVRINIPSAQVAGGEILITVEANDATDFQSRTLRFIWTAVNKGGTITATITTPEETVAVSTGTLTVTIDTNDAGSGNLDFRANATSSLTETTLRCTYQVFKNFGTGAITPQ